MFPPVSEAPTWGPEEVGEPLFLTPLVEAGELEEAREASKVWLPQAPSLPSHAGLITVNPNFDSNMFFWFFPAAFETKDAPVVLWLQVKRRRKRSYSLDSYQAP